MTDLLTYVFTVAGSYTWRCPPEIYQVKVECWGAGGGGMGYDNVVASGGGGGEYAAESALNVTPGVVYSVVIGAGGVGGVNDSMSEPPGTDGGDTSFASTVVVAHGGLNDTTAGTGSTNTIHFDGGMGGIDPGSLASYYGGNGGDSGGPTGAASPAGDSYSDQPTPGLGAGPGGLGGHPKLSSGVPDHVDGFSPTIGPGGGGGGGGNTGPFGPGGDGADGADGQVIITVDLSAQPLAAPIFLLPDAQDELSGSLLARWKCSDPGTQLFDDADVSSTNLALSVVGTPIFHAPPLDRGDNRFYSVYGSVGNYFTSAFSAGTTNVQAFGSLQGITLEGLTAAEPNGNGFNLLSMPGVATLAVNGTDLVFTVWHGATPTAMTASGVLSGWPQHVVAVWDTVGGVESICLDGALVASAPISGGTVAVDGTIQLTMNGTLHSNTTVDVLTSTAGMVAGAPVTAASGIPASTWIASVLSSTSFQLNHNATASGVKSLTIGMPIQVVAPTSASATSAAAQYLAVYKGAMSPSRVQQHFKAFRQILSDPGRVRKYPQIGVFT